MPSGEENLKSSEQLLPTVLNAWIIGMLVKGTARWCDYDSKRNLRVVAAGRTANALALELEAVHTFFRDVGPSAQRYLWLARPDRLSGQPKLIWREPGVLGTNFS